VVDDDAALRRGLARALSALGCAVETAGNGEEAIDTLRGMSFDAVILDLEMDGLDGWDVLDRCRDIVPQPATIVHSAFLNVDRAAEAMRRGADDVVEKPVKAEDLLARVRRVVAAPSDLHGAERLLGRTPAIRLVREQLHRVARFPDLTVLIQGETGTGKELVAKALHELTRPDGSLVAINAAAVPADLFESELFGHRAGSFTGAKASRTGLLEAAGRGTLFLDEVGELPLSLQPKLLRVLENRQFRRVGSNEIVPLRARVVSATNRPLAKDESLRSDLYFRLAGFVIALPPLRERMDDVPLLAQHLLESFARRYPSAPRSISPRAIDALRTHGWPGNVRELRGVVEQAAVVARGAEIGVRDIAEVIDERRAPEAPPVAEEPRKSGTRRRGSLRDMERATILEAYRENDGNLSQTARVLGIPRTTLRDKLKRYGER